METTHSKSFLLLFVIAAIATMPILSVHFPRFYAVGPGLIGVIGCLGLWLTTKTKPDLHRAFLIFPGALWLLALASIAWSVSPEISMERAQKLLLVFIPGVILLAHIRSLSADKAKRYLPLIPLGITIGMILLSLDLYFDSPIYRLTRDIPEGQTFGNAVYNRGCVSMVLCLIPAFFILKNTVQNKFIIGGFLLAFLLMLSLVESQSAQLGIVCGVAMYWLFPYRHRFAWYGLIALISTLLLATPLIAIYLFENFSALLNDMPFLGKGEGYAGGRTEIWHFVSTRALENPIMGHGIEATKAIKDFDTDKLYHEATHVLHPHNFAVQIWIEFGLLGVTTASALIGYLLLMIKKLNHAQQRIALPTFIACLSVAVTGYGFWQSWWLGLLFMVAALCILATKLERQP